MQFPFDLLLFRQSDRVIANDRKRHLGLYVISTGPYPDVFGLCSEIVDFITAMVNHR